MEHMTRSAVVLAVPHQLQGPAFGGYVDDPSYSLLLENVTRDGVDFVFEEASGRTPSTAEQVAVSRLGEDHYLDVDPSVDERPKYGIAKVTGGGGPIDPFRSKDIYESALLDEQRKREDLWVQRVVAQPFKKALIIVGLAHGLSLGFRLASAGIEVRDVFLYIPHEKVCRKPHR